MTKSNKQIQHEILANSVFGKWPKQKKEISIMTKELDEKLCKKYPKIFANRYGDMKSTAMCWGFSCF